MAPRPLKTPPPVPPRSALDDLIGSTTKLAPSATAPKSGQNFVGPTLDPSLIAARRALSQKQQQSIRAGVDPAIVKDIAAGGADPNRGFIGPAKAVGGFLKGLGGGILPDVLDVSDIPLPFTDKNLGEGALAVAKPVGKELLKTVSGPLEILGLGRNFVISALKELGDEAAVLLGNRPRGQAGPSAGKVYTMGKGGFDFKELVQQTFAGKGGIGEEGQEITGGEVFAGINNPYLNQTLGFIADVFLDPVTWTTGPGGLAKTAAQKGVFKATAEVSEAALKAEIKRGAAIAAKQAADDASRLAAQEAITIGTPAAIDAAKIAADVAKQAAKVAAQANKAAAKSAAPRLYGRTGKEALANSVREIRQKALDDIANGATGDQLAAANAAVAALTDDVIAKVAKDGYAGLTGSFKDIFRGIQTPAAEILGVQGGLRIGVPGARAIIPGSRILTDVLGLGVAGTKNVLRGGRVGAGILEQITPTGQGGLFREQDLLELRTGLQTGKLKGTNAAQASELLALDKTFRGRVELVRKAVGSIVVNTFGSGKIAKNNYKVLQSIADHVRTPPSLWTARGLGKLTVEQQKAYDAFRRYLTQLDDITREVSAGTGGFVAAREGLPSVQSTQATRWLANNPKEAKKLADELNLTDIITDLTALDLKIGDVFFGRTLTTADISGGLARFNEIARESTQKLGKNINFDFFDTDIARSIARYSENQARNFAKNKIIGELPPSTTSLFPGSPVGIGISTPATIPGLAAPRTNVVVTPANLATLNARVAAVGADLTQWNAADVTTLYDKLNKIRTTVKTTLRPGFDSAIDDATKYIDDIEAGIAAGVIDPTVATLAGDELISYATILAQGTDDIAKTLTATTPDRWKKVVDIAYDGYVKLDAINAPGVEVHPAIAELFSNIKRLDDPQFAAQAEKLLREYNQFFKTYVTATPGFHVRNALGATVQMISGGANPVTSAQGVRIYGALRPLRKKGATVPQMIEEAVKKGAIPNTPAAKKALEDVLLYSQATGFGQIGEVSDLIPGLRPGIFGTTATGDVPILGRFSSAIPSSKVGAQVSTALATPLYASRKFGAGIENTVRFAMTYDGVANGLSVQEAAARTAKFLIDYNDISSADRVLKQIIPFWMWMSRNTALQAEIVWTNPKVYKIYDSARQAVEDEEGTSEFVPDYLKDVGAFKLPGQDTYFKSPAGLLGRGEESVLSTLIEDPLKLLSRTTPALKVPAELFKNEQFFTGAPIVSDGKGNALLYAFQQLNAPGQLIGRLASFTPARRNEIFQNLTGVKSAQADPKGQEINSLWSFIGAPIFQLTPDQERGEIWRRFFDLLELETEAKDVKKTEYEDKIKKAKEQQQSGVTVPGRSALDDLITGTTAP